MDLFAPRHLIIILLIVLVVFGTKKLRSIGSDLGGAVRGFKQAMRDGEAEGESDASPPPAPPPQQITNQPPKGEAGATAGSETKKNPAA